MSNRKVRFKRAWQNYQVGHEIEPPGALRDWLTRNGYVEPVEPSPVFSAEPEAESESVPEEGTPWVEPQSEQEPPPHSRPGKAAKHKRKGA